MYDTTGEWLFNPRQCLLALNNSSPETGILSLRPVDLVVFGNPIDTRDESKGFVDWHVKVHELLVPLDRGRPHIDLRLAQPLAGGELATERFVSNVLNREAGRQGASCLAQDFLKEGCVHFSVPIVTVLRALYRVMLMMMLFVEKSTESM